MLQYVSKGQSKAAHDGCLSSFCRIGCFVFNVVVVHIAFRHAFDIVVNISASGRSLPLLHASFDLRPSYLPSLVFLVVDSILRDHRHQ